MRELESVILRAWNEFEWALIGLVGAVIAARWHKDEFGGRADLLMYLATGLVCAHFLTGMVANYFSITEARSINGVAFLIGAFCGSVIATIVRAFKSADIWKLIMSRFGGRREQ